MYEDNNWAAVTGEELDGFLSQIGQIDGKYSTSGQSTEVSYRMLPFYDNVALIRLKDRSWGKPKLAIYYLTMEGNLFRLNGTSPPIHEVNAKAPVKITDDNVLEYLRFFCFFVRGEEGPFLIAETMDDPYIPANLDPKTKAVIEGTVRAASYEGKNEQGYFMCDAVVYYSNALFIANFAVQPSGMIEMLDDEPIAADLGVKVDAPVT
ncbi:MAG: hypothetical protein DI586_00065 [Micavibrio aeruginosavorus]|uniref:Uncharacterized protein n=1 Tax=Micavibrio aeruginosavorus TaxID=349221 RepID=A0A2W5FSP5_9BACT|nr:MAG: hypothetical protein DI586_00065 [Micavibrio aeruginosavorus]